MKKVGGDLLMSNNHKNKDGMRVARVFLSISFILLLLINISFISASQKHTLKVTEEHPFFVLNNNIKYNSYNLVNVMQVGNGRASERGEENNARGNWVPAKNLQVGDFLITDNGKKAKIISIKEVVDNVEVYNLEANLYNDFIVSGDVVVHNSNRIEIESTSIPTRAEIKLITSERIEILDIYTANVDTDSIMALTSDAERIFIAERLAGRQLTEAEMKYILYLHNQMIEPSQKARILAEIFKDRRLRNAFIDYGVLGKYKKIKTYWYRCAGKKSPHVIKEILARMPEDSRALFERAFQDITDRVFLDSAGNYVDINEMPDIVLNNIRSLFRSGKWRTIGSENRDFIYINRESIEMINRINNPRERNRELRKLFLRAIDAGNYYSTEDLLGEIRIYWPADILIRNPDGTTFSLLSQISQLRNSEYYPSYRYLLEIDAAYRLEEMVHVLQIWTKKPGNLHPMLSPLTAEYIPFIKRTSYVNEMGKRTSAISETDILFFFFTNERLSPIVDWAFITTGSRLSERMCALDFLRELYRKRRIDIEPPKSPTE